MGKAKEEMRLIAIIIILSFTGCSMLKNMPESNLKYNYYEKKWEQAKPDSELKYNYQEKEWGYAW